MLSKEELFEVLLDWNSWDKPLLATVSRPRPAPGGGPSEQIERIGNSKFVNIQTMS